MADPLMPDADPADAAEQRESAAGEPVDGVAVPGPNEPVPESDAQEQATPVGGQSRVDPGPRPMDADEADWQEQSQAEPIDEEEIR